MSAFKHSAVRFGTPDTRSPDVGSSIGPISLHNAIVYAPLTILLAATYVGGVVGQQAALRVFSSQEPTLAVLASTLVIAALVTPLRRAPSRSYTVATTLERVAE